MVSYLPGSCKGWEGSFIVYAGVVMVAWMSTKSCVTYTV